jgi:hypothetical protein
MADMKRQCLGDGEYVACNGTENTDPPQLVGGKSDTSGATSTAAGTATVSTVDTSGTAGTLGTAGTVDTSGTAGTSATAGTVETSGTAGTGDTSGTAGTAGTAAASVASGIIYVLQEGKLDSYKVGFTLELTPDARIRSLQTGNPNQITAVATFVVNYGAPSACEAEVHTILEMYKRSAMGGNEWYVIPATVFSRVLSLIGEQVRDFNERAKVAREVEETSTDDSAGPLHVAGTEELKQLLKDSSELASRIKLMSADLDGKRDQIRAMLGAHSALYVDGFKCATYKCSVQTRLDTAALKAGAPDVYAKFSKQTTIRSLRLL